MDQHHDDHRAEPAPRKLTKAECGRLGGLRTKERHGTEHFRRAGKLGFAALAKHRGFMGGSRLGALQLLRRKGRITDSPADARAQADALAWAETYLDQHTIDPEGIDHDQR